MDSRTPLLTFVLLLFSGGVRAGDISFNQDIRPILAENCFYCHGQDGNQRKAELRLDVREDAVESGAIHPGEADASELVARILADDSDLLMPPADSNRQLSATEKELLQRWIVEGADYEEHWSFVAPERPKLPEVNDKVWPSSAIDRFVLAKLEAEGLKPSPEADRATLMRRLHADLTGLPPTPEEVNAFLNDADPQAYENLVERLLASPHFGEGRNGDKEETGTGPIIDNCVRVL